MRRTALGFAIAAGIGAARAEPPLAFDAPRHGLELNLGAGPLLYPAYPGAKIYRVVPFPALSGGYGDRVDFNLLDALRITAVSLDGFSAGPAGRFRFGRQTSDDRAQLTGLRSFPDTLELGEFLAYQTGPLWIDLTGTQDVARAHGGAALEAHALLSLPLGHVGLEFGPELRLANHTFNQAFFGIDASRAASTGRPSYRAAGGVERVGGVANLEWRLGTHLSLSSFVEYWRLTGSAATSPLVLQGGSADQIYAGTFLTWRFP